MAIRRKVSSPKVYYKAIFIKRNSSEIADTIKADNLDHLRKFIEAKYDLSEAKQLENGHLEIKLDGTYTVILKVVTEDLIDASEIL